MIEGNILPPGGPLTEFSLSESTSKGLAPTYDEIFDAIRSAGPSNAAKARAIRKILRRYQIGGID